MFSLKPNRNRISAAVKTDRLHTGLKSNSGLP